MIIGYTAFVFFKDWSLLPHTVVHIVALIFRLPNRVDDIQCSVEKEES